MTLQTEPQIVGVGETKVGKHPTEIPNSLAIDVARKALFDAGRDWADIDGLIVMEPIVDKHPRHALAMAETFGISSNLRFAQTVNMGGASPALAVKQAFDAISAKAANNILVIASDTPRTGQDRKESVAYFSNQRHPWWEQPIGMLNVTAYGLLADEYQHRYHLEPESMLSIPVALRAHATKNWNAAYTDPLSYVDARQSRYVSHPLRLVECSPINDGAAALLISAEKNQNSKPGIGIAGSGFGTDYDSYTYRLDRQEAAGARSAKSAIDQSRRSVGGGDLLMVYDSYSIAMALQLESLGVSEPGQAANDFANGRFNVDGDLVVNPHGGLLSHGHCGGAAGMHHITELVKQLRNEADQQVSIENGYAYYQAEGGILSANATICFEYLEK